MGPLGWNEAVNPDPEGRSEGHGRGAREGRAGGLQRAVKGLDLILSPGCLGKLRKKNWARYPRSRGRSGAARGGAQSWIQ